jgi:hypothetical protein
MNGCLAVPKLFGGGMARLAWRATQGNTAPKGGAILNKPKQNRTVTFMEWLGLNPAPDFTKARFFGILVSVVVAIFFMVALPFAMFATWAVMFGTVRDVLTNEAVGPNLGAGALIATVLGAPFLIWSTVIKQRTLTLSQTALFNDKVNAALQGLYARRQITRVVGEDAATVLTEWEDDIVQRNGAIDRLEGLANERPSEVPRIANMLSVYVRELSRGTAKNYPDGADASPKELRKWAQGLKPFRTDVEKAAQTLGRLRDIMGADLDAITIDLRGANLQGFDLNNLCFDIAKLQRARMEGADLIAARMEGAELFGARMAGAYLVKAQLAGTDLGFARMEGAYLFKAQMAGADLTEARLAGADLRFARMEGAYLREARMEGANLSMARMDAATDLTDADISQAAVWDVDYAEVRISADQINSMFGDASVILPNGVIPSHPDWPAHWPKTVLDDYAFQTEWRKWRDNPAQYTPPDP